MDLIENIKKDDFYYLKNSKDYEIGLKEGITESVDQFGNNFRDMTYIQIAIALRKPKCLKGMLETSYYKCQIPFEDIISPKTSNTKGNIISLAIEFGSKNSHYDSVDTQCLKEIINFGNSVQEKNNQKFNIDIENINGETPLIRAINYQNVEACEILIHNGANILHKSEKNQFLMSPLQYLLVEANNMSILQKVINKDLLNEKDTYYKCIEEMQSDDFKQDIHNEISNSFIRSLFEAPLPPKPDIHVITQDTPTSPTPNIVQPKEKKVCKKCGEELQPNETYEIDGALYCQSCYNEIV